jgi:acylphosphatase
VDARQRLSAVVRGQVQGVGFRWSVQRFARTLRLHGYAANRPDGSVEVVAEGSAADLDELEEFLRDGPGLAQVTAVDAQRGPASGVFHEFATK